MSNSKSALRPRSVVERFPVEVLQLVAVRVMDGDFESLCNLRLVCPAFNAVAEPLAFASLSFRSRYSDHTGMRLIKKLTALGAKSTPHSRWAATLLIEREGLFPSFEWSSAYEKRVNQALEDRTEVLVPALASLSNLKRASFQMEARDPYEDVRHALSALPKFTDLSLTFGWDMENPPTALAQFSNLSALHLTSWRLFPSVLDTMRDLITRCSENLETLTLLPYVCPDDARLTKGELPNIPLQRVAADPTFRALKKLTIDASGIKLNSSSLPTFGALTHLDIRFGKQENVNAGLWRSLEGAGVRLEALSVFPITKPIYSYLISYSGLRTLRLCHAPNERAPTPPEEDPDAMAGNIFDDVLPKHRNTLCHIAFESIKFDPFALDETKLKVVLECEKLERLWVMYDPPGGRAYDIAHPDLVRMISRIVSTLPRLYELTMQPPIQNYDRPIAPGSIRFPVEAPRSASGRYLATNRRLTPLKVAMRRGFWDSICEAEKKLTVALIGGPRDVGVDEPTQRQFELPIATSILISFPMSHISSSGLLEVLPVEVLALIADIIKCTNFATLFELRLVCQAFNSLVEPLAFASISFPRGIQARRKVTWRLRALASGDHPYSRWAQTLHIEEDALFPSVSEAGFSLASISAFMDALEDRKTFLEPAIGSLRNLKGVRYEYRAPRDPYNDVISALSTLPELENLSLSCCADTPGAEMVPVALDKFSNLRTLELASAVCLMPGFLDAVEQIIARSSTSLECFKFIPYNQTDKQLSVWGDPDFGSVEVQKITTDRLIGHHTLPRLTKLVVGANGVLLSASSVFSFTNLTQIEIQSATREGVDPSFWGALGRVGIHLQSLSIFPVGEPVSEYLASYSGLKTLRICDAPGRPAPSAASQDGSAKVTADNVFNIIIPKHRETLRHLSFEGMKFIEFMTDGESVAKLVECQGLEVLWVGYNHLISGGTHTVDLAVILECIVTGFPHLKYLTMEAIPRNALHQFTVVSSWKEAMRKAFWDAIGVAEAELGVGLVDASAENGIGRECSHRRVIQIEWQQ